MRIVKDVIDNFSRYASIVITASLVIGVCSIILAAFFRVAALIVGF